MVMEILYNLQRNDINIEHLVVFCYLENALLHVSIGMHQVLN